MTKRISIALRGERIFLKRFTRDKPRRIYYRSPNMALPMYTERDGKCSNCACNRTKLTTDQKQPPYKNGTPT